MINQLPWCVKILLNIAEEDLRAAKILYVNGLVPQSLFYLSQTCEKITKAILIMRGDDEVKVRCEDLARRLGHKPLYKGFIKWLKKYVENLQKFQHILHNEKLLEKVKSMSSSKLWSELIDRLRSDVPKYLSKVEEFVMGFETLVKHSEEELLNVFRDEEVISNAIKLAKELSNFYDTQLLQIESLNEHELLSNEYLGELRFIIKDISKKTLRNRNIDEAELDELIDLALKPFKVNLKTYLRVFTLLVKAFSLALPIETIFEVTRIPEIARYPISTKINPEALKGTLLAQKFEEIHQLIHESLLTTRKAVKELNTYINELKEIAQKQLKHKLELPKELKL